jgi:hypothetical protein
MLFFMLVPILAVAEIEEIATEAAGLESRAPVLAPSVALSGEGGRP